MNFAACRFCGPLMIAFFLLAVGQAALAQEARPAAPAAAPNLLVNAGFECGEEGYTESPGAARRRPSRTTSPTAGS